MSQEIQRDIRALYIKCEKGSAPGQSTLSIMITESLDGRAGNPGLIVDLEKNLWATERGGNAMLTSFGQVRKIGQCGNNVLDGEVFAVIDINNDTHIKRTRAYAAKALTNILFRMRGT